MRQTDTDGNTTQYGYTVENMVSRVTYADGSSLHYAYDKAGNLIRETNADGGITKYSYDPLGQVTNILSPDGTTTEYEYNADGEVVSELVRNIAYSGENDGENHYSNLVNTSSKPLVATAIRYTEDAVNANKGSGFAKPVPKTPTAPKPKTLPQEYAQAKKQATTPTQTEYVQLRKSGVNMSYGQYANQKQQTRFPSYGQYAYDKSIGKPTYQTFGPLQSTTGQINHVYDKTPNVVANATPKVEETLSEPAACAISTAYSSVSAYLGTYITHLKNLYRGAHTLAGAYATHDALISIFDSGLVAAGIGTVIDFTVLTLSGEDPRIALIKSGSHMIIGAAVSMAIELAIPGLGWILAGTVGAVITKKLCDLADNYIDSKLVQSGAQR